MATNPEILKSCNKCGQTKPLSAFYADKRNVTYGVTGQCRACMTARNRAVYSKLPLEERQRRYRSHAAKWKWYSVKHKYGITRDEYMAMEQKQDGLCAACGLPPHDGQLRIDHCHDTGRVRGLLCHQCNAALGLLKEDPARIEGLAAYAKGHC